MENMSLTKGELTRKQIIETAYRLFIQQGYHGTSMREIAREAGIALGGIYNHFATKEEIFAAVFEVHHPYNQIVPAVQQAQGDTIEILLRNTASYMVQGLKDTPDFLNLMFIDLVEFQNRHTSQVVSKNLAFFEQVYIRLMQTAGSRMRPMSPLIMARSFFGLFFSYYITGLFLRSVPNLPPELTDDTVFEKFVDIYLHGILIDDTPPEDGISL
jgi:AcrR family transcriptional regulator